MGGFTTIQLKDISQGNIDTQNALLKECGVCKKYRFYSEKNVKEEYGYYLKGDGVYQEHLFPKDKINSYDDFKKYWNTESVGEVFVPKFGSLQLDCYYGRTSKRAMRGIGRYLGLNPKQIKKVNGSFSTFVERGMTKIERQIMFEYGFLEADEV
jgi:hypothetical protein